MTSENKDSPRAAARGELPKRIFLIHGMGRTSISMLILRQRLNKAGHRCHLFGYTVTFQSFDSIVRRFTERVEKVLAEDRAAGDHTAQTYAVVSHSLGGLITRAASPNLAEGFSHFVMLAPPNHPPRRRHNACRATPFSEPSPATPDANWVSLPSLRTCRFPKSQPSSLLGIAVPRLRGYPLAVAPTMASWVLRRPSSRVSPWLRFPLFTHSS